MTTIGTIVGRAFREGNLIPIGTDPTAAELAEGVAALNGFVTALYGFDLGVELTDWPVPPPQRSAPVAAQYPLAPPRADLPSAVWPYPPVNTRLTVSIATATTVYLPEKPNDGARMAVVDVGASATLTLNANGRKINSATTATFAAGASAVEYFYRADLGMWKTIATLVEADENPLPAKYDDLLICGTSMRLAPRFGKTSAAETIGVYGARLKSAKLQYKQPTPALVSIGELVRSTQSYQTGANDGFNPLAG